VVASTCHHYTGGTDRIVVQVNLGIVTRPIQKIHEAKRIERVAYVVKHLSTRSGVQTPVQPKIKQKLKLSTIMK
jgi:hypothetical protein